ncbi:MAG: YbjN domain-containing protein [Synechococcales cyanobacterium T60_A2020_003]|nr:YbjN domain-containing protein [Synechococcales cyanobacterium T60_A2020_003]
MVVSNATLESTANQTSVEEGTLAMDYVEIIETVISSLEEDQTAMVSHTDDHYLWTFKYGSVDVFVMLTGTTDDDILKVWSPVMSLPAKDEPALLRKLMEMNGNSTFEASFGIVNNQVIVSAARTVAGLSPAEISRNITMVAMIADENDDPLQAEFGA